MKILIEESVLRQALSILVGLQYNDDDVELENAITTLRETLNAAEKVEDQLAAVTKERDELAFALRYIEDQRYLPHILDTANATLAKVGTGATAEAKP